MSSWFAGAFAAAEPLARGRVVVGALSVALAAAGLVVLGQVDAAPQVPGAPAAAVLLALLIVTARFPAPLSTGVPEVNVSAARPLLFAGVVLLPPVLLPVLVLPAVAVRSGRWESRLFTAGTELVVVACSSWVYWSVQGLQQGAVQAASARFVVACAMATAVFYVLEQLLCATVVLLVLRCPPADSSAFTPFSAGRELVELAAGAAGAALVLVSPWLAVLAASGVLGLHWYLLAASVSAAAVDVDFKTGLLTLPAFTRAAMRELALARRRGESVCVVMMDLDRFSALNEAYGHLVGDAVLGTVGQALTGTVRDTDLMTRFGGDEFTLLLLDADLAYGRQVAGRVRAAVAARTTLTADGPVSVTASLGVAQWVPTESLEDLLERADDVLYAAKRAGRDQVAVAPTDSGAGSPSPR